MKKKLILILLAVLMLCVQMAAPVPASAASLPEKWEAPSGLILTDNSTDSFSLKLTYNKGADLSAYLSLKSADQRSQYGYGCVSACLQVDWTIDSATAGWKYHENWDVIKNGCSEGSTNWEYWHEQLRLQTTDYQTILRLQNEDMWGWNDPVKGIGQFLKGKTYTKQAGGKTYHYIDLTQHTVYARARFVLQVSDAQNNRSFVLSDWSDIAAVGKDAGSLPQRPESLEAPVLSNLVITDEIFNGAPVAAFNLSNPAQVKKASVYAKSKGENCYVMCEISLENGPWKEVNLKSRDIRDSQYEAPLFSVAPETDKDSHLRLRAYYSYHSHLGAELFRSGYSNTVEFGAPAWGKASSWATGDLQKADEYGLIPDILRGADLTKPITREEFCELALLLYEKTTGKSPAPASHNPFTDTQNPEILKAYQLRITSGTSATTFSPGQLIPREQVAAMLCNAIRAMVPDSDFSTAGAPVFSDQGDISPWALESVKYITKMGIIRGADGKFMPKATTTAQQAAGYGRTTREAAILMSMRTYEAMPAKAAAAPAQTAPAGETAGFSGKWSVTDPATGDAFCTITLSQSGSAVTGTFTDANQNSSGMSGTVAGSVLTATIDHPFFAGWKFVLTMNAGNNSFTGVWTNSAESHAVTGSRA